MALTMTRNRTQTTLTKLAERVASVHGELAYVEARLGGVLREELREGLARRRGDLLAMRAALYVTLRQFDPGLEPTDIGTTEEWLKPFGRGRAGKKRYEVVVTAAPGGGLVTDGEGVNGRLAREIRPRARPNRYRGDG